MQKPILSVIATILMIIGLGGVATLSPAYAEANVTCADGTVAASFSDCQESTVAVFEDDSLIGVVSAIINTVIGLVGVASVALMIIGGVGYATAQGEPAKIKSRDTILYGAAGVALTLVAVIVVACDVFGQLIGV